MLYLSRPRRLSRQENWTPPETVHLSSLSPSVQILAKKWNVDVNVSYRLSTVTHRQFTSILLAENHNVLTFKNNKNYGVNYNSWTTIISKIKVRKTVFKVLYLPNAHRKYYHTRHCKKMVVFLSRKGRRLHQILPLKINRSILYVNRPFHSNAR